MAGHTAAREVHHLVQHVKAVLSLSRYKHALYISKDANFKLRRKAKLTRHDIAMGDGGLYFVEEQAYKDHLSEFTEETEVRTSSCRNVLS